MVLRASAEHSIDRAGSYFVGDKRADIECGRRAGTRTVLVLTGYGRGEQCTPDYVCEDAVEAVESIISGRFPVVLR